MHFDLTSLKLFVQVAESKNITKGAEKMHLSLPAVSNRIKELELSLIHISEPTRPY